MAGYMYDDKGFGDEQAASVRSNAQASAASNSGTSDYHFGDFLGNVWYGLSGSRQQNEYNERMYERELADNSRLAAEQRAWEERMSNSTYQRTVADMKRAGINPAILSGLTSGSANSIGSGSAASASSKGSGSGVSSGAAAVIGSVLGVLLLRNKKALKKAITSSL